MISVDGLFYFGADILKTTIVAGKVILAQLGDVLTGVSESDDAEWWQHVGFVSRPPKPEAKKRAAQVVGVRGGIGRDVVIASRDLRGLELAGTLDDGETCVYAPGPDGLSQGRILLKKTGAIAIYTREGNTAAGAGMTVMVDPMTDSVTAINSKGFGLIVNADGVTLTAGEASLTLNADGSLKLVGTGKAQVDGGSVAIGNPMAPVITAPLRGPSGMLGTPSIKVAIE